MSRVKVMIQGGGGTSSDELTATRSDVLVGKTAVTRDSGDEAVEGTLEERIFEYAIGGVFLIRKIKEFRLVFRRGRFIRRQQRFLPLILDLPP